MAPRDSYLSTNTAFYFASFVQNTVVFSGFVLGRTVGILPKRAEPIISFLIGILSVLHASSNVIGVFSTNLVGSIIPVYDSDPLIEFGHPVLFALGGYTWTITGILADSMMALLSVRKLLFVLSSAKLIKLDLRKHWYVPYLGGTIIALPGIFQVIWLYLALVAKTGLKYDDYTAKYLVAVRLVFIKGADIAFFVEMVRYAQSISWDRQKLIRTIPRTLEAVVYYMISTSILCYYFASSNKEVVRLLRNLTNKGTEVGTFLYLNYASIYEISYKEISKTGSRDSTHRAIEPAFTMTDIQILNVQ